VVVLVGPPASGKSTVRRQLVAEGLPADLVVSLDDLRRELRDRSADPRPLQDYTLVALRIAADRQRALVEQGRGYLADAQHLRRRERVAHVAAAGSLTTVAILLPDLPVEVLLARNALRDDDERVPTEVIARAAHRRSLLTAGLLRAEGFTEVRELHQEPDAGA
jgi:predicted kinase